MVIAGDTIQYSVSLAFHLVMTDIRFNELVDRRQDILVAGHIVECVRSILLYPRIGSDACFDSDPPRDTYHGRLSSSSTGRLAALLLPLAFWPIALKTIDCSTASPPAPVSSSLISMSDMAIAVKGLGLRLEVWVDDCIGSVSGSTRLRFACFAIRLRRGRVVACYASAFILLLRGNAHHPSHHHILILPQHSIASDKTRV